MAGVKTLWGIAQMAGTTTGMINAQRALRVAPVSAPVSVGVEHVEVPAAKISLAVVLALLIVIGAHGWVLTTLLSTSATPAQVTTTQMIVATLISAPPVVDTAKIETPVSPLKAMPPPKPLSQKMSPKLVVKTSQPVVAATPKAITLPKPEPKSVVKEVPVPIEVAESPPPSSEPEKHAPITKVVSSVIPPRTDATQKSNPPPVYPRTALRLRQEGTVMLALLVRADGSADEVSLKTSSGYTRLDKAALKAVKRWRYQPAIQGGEAVDYWYEQAIVFSMRKD